MSLLLLFKSSFKNDLASNVVDLTTVTANLDYQDILGAIIIANTTINAALDHQDPLAASPAVVVTVTSALDHQDPLAASPAANVTVTSSLDHQDPLAANAVSNVTISGALDHQAVLSAVLAANVTVLATLAGGASDILTATIFVSTMVRARLDSNFSNPAFEGKPWRVKADWDDDHARPPSAPPAEATEYLPSPVDPFMERLAAESRALALAQQQAHDRKIRLAMIRTAILDRNPRHVVRPSQIRTRGMSKAEIMAELRERVDVHEHNRKAWEAL